ncbi:putative transcriptional regulator [Anaerotaenia torta]|uniref:BlaI/MecI/CopY family transcriptional regulator n=1 Tax=Anaerotaenia torta TaxID=433293 RepID=UPI003D22609B
MAKNITLTAAEEKLAALIWREAPLTSPDLVVLAEREMDWKKSTTYTVLKKLCDKGVFKNENTNVSVVLTRDEQIARQSRRYVEEAFGGSLPKFITSFISGRKLTPEQAAELKRLIEEHEEGGNHG